MPSALFTGLAAATLLCLATSQGLDDNLIDPETFLYQPAGVTWSQLSWTRAWAQFPPKASPTFDYAEALHKAFIFLRIQRSGNITTPDQHVAWRSDSCFTCKAGSLGPSLLTSLLSKIM